MTSRCATAIVDSRDMIHAAVPEAGGTIGPLPDGTVIEVQPIHVTDPAMHAGWVEIWNRHHAQGS